MRVMLKVMCRGVPNLCNRCSRYDSVYSFDHSPELTQSLAGYGGAVIPCQSSILHHELIFQAAWGAVWTRPGLELKQRSLISITLLASQAKEAEVSVCARSTLSQR